MKTSPVIKKMITRKVIRAALAAGILIIGLALTGQPFSAEAKGRFQSRTSPEEMVEHLADRLGLTEQQVAAVRPIIEEKVLKMNEISEKKAENRRAVLTEIQRLKWDTDMKLGSILTDEQITRYLELRQEHRKHQHRDKSFFSKNRGGWTNRGYSKIPEQVIERLRDRLDLTEEQTVQAQPIIRKSLEKRNEIKNRYKEQGLKMKQALRTEMQAVGDEMHSRLSTILTEEQVETLNKMKEEKRSRMHNFGLKDRR